MVCCHTSFIYRIPCFRILFFSQLTFKMHTMGLHLTPVMKEFVPNERMAWEVRRGNLTAYHAWVIVPTANGCRLITTEAQSGFLTFLQKVFQPNKLLNLHEHWLEVIKARAEETTPTHR